MPSPSDRLTTALTSLIPPTLDTTSPTIPDSPNPHNPTSSNPNSPTSLHATSPTPSSPHRLATAKSGHGCNHGDLADELENIAEDLQILVGQLRTFEWNEQPAEIRDRWGNLPSRPVHVEVDAEAWTSLRAALVHDRKGVGFTVGRLIRDAIGRRRFIREDDEQSPDVAGRRAKVFIRLQDVNDATWRGFKATAMEHHVTAARLIGLVIEAEARRRGHWQGY